MPLGARWSVRTGRGRGGVGDKGRREREGDEIRDVGRVALGIREGSNETRSITDIFLTGP